MEEFLKKLGIEGDTTVDEDGCLIVNLLDSDDYARAYSKLDKSDLVEEDETASQVTLDNSSIQYISEDDKYILTLLADFDGDVYTLSVRES